MKSGFTTISDVVKLVKDNTLHPLRLQEGRNNSLSQYWMISIHVSHTIFAGFSHETSALTQMALWLMHLSGKAGAGLFVSTSSA